MTLTKTSNRVIAFLMCVIVMMTVCVFQPIHEAKALVGIDDAALIALILALLAGCGVAIEVTTDEGLQGIAEDYWNSASEGAKTLIQDLETKMQSYTDPHTGTYVKSKVKIGTQEYIDLHSSVNQWASEKIIEGNINIHHNTTTSYPKSEITWTLDLIGSRWNTVYNGVALTVEKGEYFRVPYYQSNTNYGYLDYILEIETTSATTFRLKATNKIINNYDNTTTINEKYTSDFNGTDVLVKYTFLNTGLTYLYYKNTIGTALYMNDSIGYTTLYDPVEVTKDPYLPPIFVPANKNTWPYKIIDRMHDLNVENPEGTGEYEFTVNVEEPVKNLNPANVLPAEFIGDISTPATPPIDYSNPNTDRPSLKAKFISVFPFCLPWDLKQAFALLAAEPEAPYFSVDFLAPVRDKIGITGSTTITLDMDEYPMVGEIIRWTVLISFSIGLILVTRQIIKS